MSFSSVILDLAKVSTNLNPQKYSCRKPYKSYIVLTVFYGINTHSKADFRPPTRGLQNRERACKFNSSTSSTPVQAVSPLPWFKTHCLHRVVKYLPIDLCHYFLLALHLRTCIYLSCKKNRCFSGIEQVEKITS